MREGSAPALRDAVLEFLNRICVLPQWIDGAESGGARGHYEWGRWGDALRARKAWMRGAAWRSLIAALRGAGLPAHVAALHRVKDQLVWEVVAQAYGRAEAARGSTAPAAARKTRIRSVFSWQRRHDTKKHSLIWLIDLAFALVAYDAFAVDGQGDASVDLAELAPADIGRRAHALDIEMTHARVLPFYARVPLLPDAVVAEFRVRAGEFVNALAPPYVAMCGTVKETRGMPREGKAVDFATPWLALLAHEAHEARWAALIAHLEAARRSMTLSPALWDALLAECCRAVVGSALAIVACSDDHNAGYVADIAAAAAVAQSHVDLLVAARRQGYKRKRLVPRQSFRRVLQARLQQWQHAHGAADSHSPSDSRTAAPLPPIETLAVANGDAREAETPTFA